MVKLSNRDVEFARKVSNYLGKTPDQIQRMLPDAWDTMQNIQYALGEARRMMGDQVFGTPLQDLIDAGIDSPDGNKSAAWSRIKKLYESLDDYYEDFNAVFGVIQTIEMVTDPKNLAESNTKRLKAYDWESDEPLTHYKRNRRKY